MPCSLELTHVGADLGEENRDRGLGEAQEAAHKRARALRLPVFEVAPWESLTQVADRDGVYLSFTVYDELTRAGLFSLRRQPR